VVFERVLARRLCSQCGLDYNLIHHRPAIADTCDVCGGKLTIRSDDNEEGLRQRLKDYRTQTEPVLELFGRKELVIQTNGALGIDEIRADIRAQLGLRKTK
jgi:adenylate kinase